MSIEQFAEITRKVIARDGFDGFLPTLCLPVRRHIAVLEGAPTDSGADMRSIALKWVSEKISSDEEYLIAIKESSESFLIIRHVGLKTEEKLYSLNEAKT